MIHACEQNKQNKTQAIQNNPYSKRNHKWDLCFSVGQQWEKLNREKEMEMGEVSSLWWEKDFGDLRKSLHSSSKKKKHAENVLSLWPSTI